MYAVEVGDPESSSTENEDLDVQIQGREDEKKEITSTLAQSPVQSVCIIGESGLGKSALLATFATPPDAFVVNHRPTTTQKQTPWSTARRLCRAFKKLAGGLSQESQKLVGLLDDVFPRATLERTSSLGSIRRRSLASPVTIPNLQSTSPSDAIDLSTLTGESRQTLIIQLLRELVSLHSADLIYFLIDDCHNVDAASTKFLSTLNSEEKKVFVVYATSKDPPASAPTVKLSRLKDDSILKIFCLTFGISPEVQVEERLSSALFSAASGSPLYTKILCNFLKKERHLSYKRDENYLSLNERGVAELASLPSAITSHLQTILDSMSPESTLLVRCATLLNHNFQENELGALFPLEHNLPPPPHSFCEILRAGLLERDERGETGGGAKRRVFVNVHRSLHTLTPSSRSFKTKAHTLFLRTWPN